ncbi:MAG: hypothetical protein OEX08_02520 [Candidatus Nomurabacteria bacterium]|nr:hypothetical protein [Candidatus Nomurabacteria bacterium]
MFRTFISIALITLSILGIVFFVMPRWGNVQVITDEQKELDVALNNALELQRIRQSLAEKADNISAISIDRLGKIVPDNIDNVKLILELDVLAKNQGVNLQNVQVIDSAVRRGDDLGIENRLYKDMVLEFSVQSTYDNLVSFLDRLDNSLRLVDVESIAFSTRSQDSVVSYTMRMRSYYLAS